MIFAQLNYIKLKVHYRAVTKVFLTDNKGSSLSGLFKTALRHICCDVQKNHCRPNKRNKEKGIEERVCQKSESCIYAFTAEHVSNTGEDTVLPYIISCSSIKQRYIPRDSLFTFELVLIGNVASYFNEILAGLILWKLYNISKFRAFYTSKEIDEFGYPDKWPVEIKPHGTLSLEKVEQVIGDNIIPIYHSDSIVRSPVIETLEMKTEEKEDNASMVKISFNSLAQLKKKKQIVQNNIVDFNIFYHALSRRLISLIQYFGLVLDHDMQIKEYQYCHNLVSDVRIIRNDLKMEKIIRGTNLKEYYDGFKGEIIFENVNSCFKPWIKAGELIHIGKSPTLGFGEFDAVFF